MQEQHLAATTADQAHRKAKLIVDTAGVRIVEYTFQPGDANPWHYHSEVSDRFYCLAGLISVDTVIGADPGAPAQTLVLRPGESCEISPRTVHHARNAGDGISRYLLIQALGKYDFVEVVC